MLLIYSRQITRHILECNNRNIKGIAIADKTGSLIRAVTVEHSGHYHRLISYESDCIAMNTTKSDYDICCPKLLYFKEIRIIYDTFYNITYVVRLFRIGRNDIIDRFVKNRFFRFPCTGTLLIVPRNKRHQFLDLFKTLLFTLCIEMSITCNFSVNASSS